MSIWKKVFSSDSSHSQKDPSVLDLRIGDTVSHDLMDFLVVGQITYLDDEGSTWTDYELEGDGDTWLVFEKDLDLVGIYKPAELILDGNPPKEIKYQGVKYYLCESGRAGITEIDGQRVTNGGSSVKYWQYQDNTGGNVLYCEDRDGQLEISCGYCIRPRELRLIRKLRAIY